MNNNLASNLSKVTQIPKSTLDDLARAATLVLGHSAIEQLTEKQNIVEMDIGIGRLYIKFLDNEIKYKFIPSKQLDYCIKDAVNNKNDPLINALELNLRERIERTYKRML